MDYKKQFDPEHVQIFEPSVAIKRYPFGDWSERLIYVYTDEIILAVNVALATGRPLLLRGAPGSGKSTLARSVARTLGWHYYVDVISSRSQARDLLYRFDTLRRLNDAQVGNLKNSLLPYIDPGVLWWAFDFQSAKKQFTQSGAGNNESSIQSSESKPDGAVVLLDEIDKADPDLPNNLLVPLGSLEFSVPEIGMQVQTQKPPLVIITTNEERELPSAFLRRCIVLELLKPERTRLIEIANSHYGPSDQGLYEKIADLVLAVDASNARFTSNFPGVAEYLDAVRACIELEVKPEDSIWESISQMTLRKLSNNGMTR